LDLDAYFERIGYQGAPRPDEETFTALHEAHLASIPYENLDLQLGETKPLDEDRFAERLVGEGRGGWCYEMNGLFSCALRKIGFRVDRLGGAVVRDIMGEQSIGNHMVLRVDLGRIFIADVGLGDGPLHPFPLEKRSWTESGLTFALERTQDDWWRFQNHQHGLAPRFDFEETPRELKWYETQCHFLQNSDQSPFIAMAMSFKRDPEKIRALRELTYIEIEGSKKTERQVTTLPDYQNLLGQIFSTACVLDTTRLWEHVSCRVAARAEEAFLAQAREDSE
jgi:N-hydroxyarylamine O-acetyltransferase